MTSESPRAGGGARPRGRMPGARGVLATCGLALLATAAAIASAGCGAAARAAEPVVTEFPAGQLPTNIAAGPDGALWFTELFRSSISRMTPEGVVTPFTDGITPMSGMGGLLSVSAGPDGEIWFTEGERDKIGRVTPAGVVTEFSAGITAGSFTNAITQGPDGNLWFTENRAYRVGRITPAGVVTEFSNGITPDAQGSGLGDIVAGPDGALWFTEPGNRIGRITTAGAVTEFPLGIEQGSPSQLAPGSDGNVWFSEKGTPSGLGTGIGRITPTGVVTFHPVPTLGEGALAQGPDGAVWFLGTDYIGRITPDGTVTPFRTGIRAGSGLRDITAGPGGALWFTMQSDSRIGRLVPPGPEPPATSTITTAPVVTTTKPPAAPLGARASLRVAAVRGGFRVVALRLAALSAGSRVRVRCLRGCSVRSAFVARTRTKDLTALFRGLVLRRGAVISVTVTRAGAIGRYVRWTLGARGVATTRCRVSERGALVRCVR